MARQLDMKIGVGDTDSALAFTQPVTGEIGGLKITVGPRDANLSLGGFGPGVALDGGYYQIDLIDETTAAAGYTEAAVAFRPSTANGWTGPHYLHNPHALGAPGAVEEMAAFLSFAPLNHNRRQVFAATGGTNYIETLARVVVTIPQVDASGTFVTNIKTNTNRDMLDAGLNQRRVTVCFSVRVQDAANQVVRMYSHIAGEAGWTKDSDFTVARHHLGVGSDAAYPGWSFGARVASDGVIDRGMMADVYGFALMAGPEGSVPDFASGAVRNTFFDVASGTMNGRSLDAALAPYVSSVLFAKHGAGWDATSGGSLSDASAFALPIPL